MKINNDSEFHPFFFKQSIPLFPAQNVLYCYQTTQKVFNSDIFINQKYWKQIFFSKHFREAFDFLKNGQNYNGIIMYFNCNCKTKVFQMQTQAHFLSRQTIYSIITPIKFDLTRM